MMQIAITGATGFVGASTLDVVLNAGHEVRALTRRPQHARDRVTWVSGTLANEPALAELCEGVHAVVHIAGLTNTQDPADFEIANVAGTANMIAAAKASGAQRFVFVSSLSAREPKLSAYGHSKARAEELVKESGLDWTIVRPPAVYGPREVDIFELFRSAKMGIVPVPPEGRTSIIHVEDLARLLLALCPVNRMVSGQTYEPWDDNGFGYEHKELAKMIAEAVGRPNAFVLALPAGAMRLGSRIDTLVRGHKAKLTDDRVSYMLHEDWVCDLRKAPPISLWQAIWNGEEGLAMTAAWYKKEGWL